MGKRSNQTATKSTIKKAKTDPVLVSIGDVIMEAEELPSRCRDMLVAVLPFSLNVKPDERHVIQTAAVEMVEQTLHCKKSSMERIVLAEEEKLAKLKSSQTELASAVSAAETALATHKEVLHTRKCELAEATTAANTSQASLTELTTEQRSADSRLQSIHEEKGSLELAFENHFKPMKDDAAGPHFKMLEPILKNIQMEESLLIALPSTCAKSKEHRGTFDNVVIEELEKAIHSKVSALDEAISVETPATVERQAAVQAAEKEHDAKNEAQKQAVAEFEAAQKEQSNRETSFNKAKQELDGLEPEISVATGLIEKAKMALEAFESGPMAGFKGFSVVAPAEPEVASAGA